MFSSGFFLIGFSETGRPLAQELPRRGECVVVFFVVFFDIEINMSFLPMHNPTLNSTFLDGRLTFIDWSCFSPFLLSSIPLNCHLFLLPFFFLLSFFSSACSPATISFPLFPLHLSSLHSALDFLSYS